MALQSERTYLIVPKGSAPGADVVGIGPVPAIDPPMDVPARIIALAERWLLRLIEGGSTYYVYAGPKGHPDDYKWVVKEENVLFVSSVRLPDSFRFESAGEGFYAIGIPNEDSLLTADKNASPQPQLTFKPADGSDSQRFRVIPIERDD